MLLKPDAAQNLGFALHELASNAAKYGALSVPEGRVSIAWRLLPETDGNGVEFDWVESCGPAVVKPAHRGFGIMVIERNLARELDTHVELAFWAEGGAMQNPASPTAVGGHQLKTGPVDCRTNVSPGHFPWRSVHPGNERTYRIITGFVRTGIGSP